METNTQEQIYFVSNLDKKENYIKLGEKVFYVPTTPSSFVRIYLKFIRRINPLLDYRFRFDVYFLDVEKNTSERLDVTVMLDKENFYRIYEFENIDRFFIRGKWMGYDSNDCKGTFTWLDRDLTCSEVEKIFSIKLINE